MRGLPLSSARHNVSQVAEDLLANRFVSKHAFDCLVSSIIR